MDAFGTGGHRHAGQPHVFEDLATHQRHLGGVAQFDAGARVQVQHQTVGVLLFPVRPEAPLRGVQLECRDLGEPREGGGAVEKRIRVDACGVLDGAGWHPLGRRILEVFAEEALLIDAFGPPLPGHRAPSDLRDEYVGDRLVVAHDIGLCGAGSRVEHFVQVAHGELAAADADPLVVRHGPTVEACVK